MILQAAANVIDELLGFELAGDVFENPRPRFGTIRICPDLPVCGRGCVCVHAFFSIHA